MRNILYTIYILDTPSHTTINLYARRTTSDATIFILSREIVVEYYIYIYHIHEWCVLVRVHKSRVHTTTQYIII